ncbi:hypothetical protein [Siccirubricoccus sp. G192]|uniref:hypothetical protein n=1 Tax=Siccirubricoccus sp. G192 TaxID=2849651 RepID=UPI001C2C5FBA|nr:hypothetical protein [Siccirubricoccus sp. G192]MBV1800630.1 hypothetical protein [Siccirubricoccus sp. G192]MBV1800694.1 hypothetical protein [Siccirubricoccus sp. G192]
MQITRKHDQSAPCGDVAEACAPGASRNRYFGGKLMNARDFTAEQGYLVARRRLVNRAMFGAGVVHGLAVRGPDGKRESRTERLEIGPGLAFDRHGREIALAMPLPVKLDELIVRIDDKNWCRERPTEGHWLLMAHYAERLSEAVRVPDPCGCGEAEWSRICETIVLSLRRIGQEGCKAPPEPCPRCACPPGSEARRPTEHAAEQMQSDSGYFGDADAPGPVRRACLCGWAEQVEVAGEPGALCEFRPGLSFDPASGVALACVKVEMNDGCPVFVLPADECTPRPIVKRNDLLYDLIRGCDLTRLAWISWAEWHRGDPVPWDKFAGSFEPAPPNCPPDELAECVTHFTFGFDGPVIIDTVTPDAVAITALIQDGVSEWGGRGTRWGDTWRVPVIRLEPHPEPDDPAGTARSFTIVVNGRWAESQIFNTDLCRFLGGPSTIEIEIRGDMILDCRGQAVDANTFGAHRPDAQLGGGRGRSGNGTPGGSFLSPIHLERR